MSHIDIAPTVYTSLEDVAAAALRLGGQFHQDRKTFITYGGGHGYCDHVVGFPGAQYEVGVVKQDDGTFRMAFDSWSSGGLLPYMGDQGYRFAQAYAVEAAKRAAQEIPGAFVSETVRGDGYIEVELLVQS